MSIRRAAPFPAFVMPLWRRVAPLECSDGTRPRYAISWRGLLKRVMSPSSATSVTAATRATPRRACSASTYRRQRPRRQSCDDVGFQTVAPLLRRLDGRNTVFQHDIVDRLVE